jgi:hypothetical protein
MTMPTESASLDVALLAIDVVFVGFWALVGLALLGGGPEFLAEAWHWWRSR